MSGHPSFQKAHEAFARWMEDKLLFEKSTVMAWLCRMHPNRRARKDEKSIIHEVIGRWWLVD